MINLPPPGQLTLHFQRIVSLTNHRILLKMDKLYQNIREDISILGVWRQYLGA